MDLYRELVLEHYRTPHNFGLRTSLPNGQTGLPAVRQASSFNPLCGDRVTVQVDIANDAVAAMRFAGHGCAISIATASLLSEYVVDHPINEIKELDATLVQTLLGTELSPLRLKCALLPLKTLQQALTTK